MITEDEKKRMLDLEVLASYKNSQTVLQNTKWLIIDWVLNLALLNIEIIVVIIIQKKGKRKLILQEL